MVARWRRPFNRGPSRGPGVVDESESVPLFSTAVLEPNRDYYIRVSATARPSNGSIFWPFGSGPSANSIHLHPLTFSFGWPPAGAAGATAVRLEPPLPCDVHAPQSS